MTSSLAPSLLLSMPQLVDPNFSRTVVLMCKHSDEGAFGLVVNRPLVTTGRIVVDIDAPAPTSRARREDAARESERVLEQELQVWIGGPVEPERSWILVGDGLADEDHEQERGTRIAEGLYLSTS